MEIGVGETTSAAVRGRSDRPAPKKQTARQNQRGRKESDDFQIGIA
jgi:hypothetical protein